MASSGPKTATNDGNHRDSYHNEKPQMGRVAKPTPYPLSYCIEMQKRIEREVELITRAEGPCKNPTMGHSTIGLKNGTRS